MNEPKKLHSRGVLDWFDPRGRQVGGWGFIINRISAIGLTVYLYLHLVMLGKLAQGPESFDAFIATAKQPLILFGELLVIIAGLYHGLNGIRIALTSFGVAVRYQRALLIGVVLLTAAGSLFFAIRMLSIH
ncbi:MULTISPECIES: putative succinate dehydrogenase cytochrome b subunit [Anaerolinea]|uniref:Succinate dehydrogenase cytochrome b subunit n=1 Tax=Anaerolinea thermophila (strain DSM 14523 / JCM 11388 / NBRC 100420 / UNI-1) TaxID=926569 RepID=E8N141_ANATU|nr:MULTISPECIES: putative succinate dehydrogenase cytochrome b subunit [Anaerolinea]BAJ64784.1 putative succinate dehydrogenase cytochrome b subunit [Anaerolinea thermophila UNI-1]